LENNAASAHAPNATGQKGRDGQMDVMAQANKQAMPMLAPTAMRITAPKIRILSMGNRKRKGAEAPADEAKAI